MKYLEQSLDGNNQFWKYVVVLLLTFIATQVIGVAPLMAVIMYQTIQNGDFTLNPSNIADFSGMGISSNFGLFLMLIPFAVGLVALILLIKVFHKRSFSETVNGRKKVRWNKFFQGVIVWGIILVAYLAFEYFSNPSNFVLQFDLGQFIPLLFISLLFIPLQTTFEELSFRGYLAQGIAGWTKSRWLALLIPAVLFGLMHIMNPEIKEFGFWITMPQYIWFGLFFGIIAILDDGIELAMGVHAINNVFASLFVTHKSSALQTPAIFEQQLIDPKLELILLIVMSLIAFAIFAKKYKWNFSILNQKITKETNHVYHEQEN